MSDLPTVKIESDEPPFTHVALDFFCPFEINNGRKMVKRYGVVFTYMASSAFHLEVAYSLDTDSFINALRRVVSKRGNIKSITCDDGTNLRAGERELRKAVLVWNQIHIENWFKQNTIV